MEESEVQKWWQSLDDDEKGEIVDDFEDPDGTFFRLTWKQKSRIYKSENL